MKTFKPTQSNNFVAKTDKLPDIGSGWRLMETKALFEKEYDGESIVDLSRDISECFDERFNKAMVGIPEMEDSPGFLAGTFVVTVKWKAE